MGGGRNYEGYPDPTFFAAWSSIKQKEREERQKKQAEKRRRRIPHGSGGYCKKDIEKTDSKEAGQDDPK